MNRIGRFALPWFVVSLTVACGGSQPEAASAEPAEEAPASEASSERSGAEPAAEPPAAEEPKPVEEKPQRIRTPKDVISSQGVMFTFSFRKSDAYEKAKEKCESKSGDDPEKIAKCMTKAHDAFEGDSIAFRKDDEGTWWWTTIQRRGNSLTALHKIEFDFGEETDMTITIKPKGRDKGSKPMGRIPSALVIEVPDDSGIILTDPTHGKMFYEAKMGLIGENER
jgi:hypothetical protein